jgi:hypothetical protein
METYELPYSKMRLLSAGLGRLHRRDSLFHLPGEVRGDAEQPLNHHQLAAVDASRVPWARSAFRTGISPADKEYSWRHRSSEECFLRLDALVFDGMAIGQHALVQNAGDEDTVAVPAVTQDVRTVFMASQTRTNVITGTTQLRIGCQLLAA